MKFDAYHCTIQTDPEVVISELSRLYFTGDFRPISGKTHGYERLGGWFLGNIELARVYWGGNGGGVSVQCKGAGTPELVKRVRIVFPEHAVSRCDVAVDFDYPGAWEDLAGFARQMALAERLKLKEVLGHGDGDTVYVGSPRSVMYLRVYMKGKELFGPEASPDHVRVEIEVKPGTAQAKRLVARMSPRELFGGSEWGRKLAAYIGESPPVRVKLGTVWRDPETERARRALVKQYWHTITAWVDEVGGASEVLRVMSEYSEGEYGQADYLEPDEQAQLDAAWDSSQKEVV